MESCKLLIVMLVMVFEIPEYSVGIPVSGDERRRTESSEVVGIPFEKRARRGYDGELDFPDNYDYEFSDVGDFFGDYPAPQDAHAAQKRYSDAISTDLLGRLGRMRAQNARDKFLQMIMGKRAGDSSLSELVEILRQKQNEENNQVNSALEELRMLNLVPRAQERSSEPRFRAKRHEQSAYERRAVIVARLQAAAKRRSMFQDYFKENFETPEFLKRLLPRQR